MEQKMAGIPQLRVPEEGKAFNREADCHKRIRSSQVVRPGGSLTITFN